MRTSIIEERPPINEKLYAPSVKKEGTFDENYNFSDGLTFNWMRFMGEYEPMTSCPRYPYNLETLQKRIENLIEANDKYEGDSLHLGSKIALLEILDDVKYIVWHEKQGKNY